MKPKDIYRIVVIISVTTIISITFIFNIVKIIINIKGNPKDLAYIGETNDNIDYNIYIKNNPYIEEQVLTDNNSYITSLVDYINLNFNYQYKIDRDINLTYNYLIKANIVGMYGEDGINRVINPIWNKEYILIDQTDNILVNQTININESINLNIKFYNDLVASFITDYNIPLNSSLEIKLIINFEGDINNYKINNEHYLLASIPLGVKAFDITTSKNFVEKEMVYLKPVIKKETGYMKVIIYIVIDILLISVSLYLIKKIIDKYRSKYILEKNKILKEYDERIVEVTNFIKYEKWETIDITSFSELLNLSNEAFEPIFYWERRYNHNKEAWFCILRDKVLYRYILYKNEYIKTQKNTDN